MKPTLKTFQQVGFFKQKETDTEYIGRCPFCTKSLHFYLNKKTMAWNCKKCGKSGGVKRSPITEAIAKFGIENFKGAKAIKLSKQRGIKIATLRKHKVGYLPSIDRYIIPVYDPSGQFVMNIRIYIGKKLIGLSGHPTGLYGWDSLNNQKGDIWLCEGHWDAMALSEIVTSKQDCILAVPGADVFKGDWVTMLKDRKVNVLLDHDEAGQRGSIKIYNMLKSHVRSLLFLHWDLTCEEGYDIRDEIQNGGTIKKIKSLLKDFPPSSPEIDAEIAVGDPDDILDGKGLHFEKVYKSYQDYLFLDNTDVLDVMFGTIIGNRLEGDPLWLLLVAPPGATKTALIQTLDDSPKIFRMSTLTASTLVSGYGGQGPDPSYIPRFNKKVVTVKDFTVILNMNQTAREEVFSILRDAYDGKVAKPFGNNIYRDYESVFGILGGVTPVIEQYVSLHALLGERFLRYTIPVDTSARGARKYMRKAMSNVTKDRKMKDDLRETAFQVLNYDFTSIPVLPNRIKERIMVCAQFIAMIRGTVTRDKYTKDITHKAFWELGTRLTKELTKLILGIGMFKGLKKVSNEEYRIIKDVTRSSIPSIMNDIMCRVYRETAGDRLHTTGEISKMINLPKVITGRLLENLSMLNVTNRIEVGKHTSQYRWKLTDDIIELIKEGELYN